MPISAKVAPPAIRICACTRSMPVISSVTVCSTWTKALAQKPSARPGGLFESTISLSSVNTCKCRHKRVRIWEMGLRASLYSGIDFQKVIAAMLVNHELHCASILVPNGFAQLDCICMESVSDALIQPKSRRHFHNLRSLYRLFLLPMHDIKMN